jgi:hypothetical protein
MAQQPLTLITYWNRISARRQFSIIKTKDIGNWQGDHLTDDLKILADGNELSLINSLQRAIDSYKKHKPHGG